MLCASGGLTFGLRPNASGLRTGPNYRVFGKRVNRLPLESFIDAYFVLLLAKNHRGLCVLRLSQMTKSKEMGKSKEVESKEVRKYGNVICFLTFLPPYLYTSYMRILLQRVMHAAVSVEGETVGSINKGYLLFIGVMDGDREEQAEHLAAKITKLRLFDGPEGKINDKSILDIGGEILVVSQFTLAGKTEKGNRPDYTGAADPETANVLYEQFIALLIEAGVRNVQSGTFGAHMSVELVNDGPVTLMLERI
jgi:D-tyrosyl-tRNA(Tyr) deacylase